jgi:hypothetical protein
MKRQILLLTTFGLTLSLFAQNVNSYYKKGIFTTVVTTPIKASGSSVQTVMYEFMDQYNNNLAALFKWATKSLKLQGEPDDFIIFNIKSHHYDKVANSVKGLMDIDVPFIGKSNKNISYTTRWIRQNDDLQHFKWQYAMPECDKVIDNASADFDIVQKNEDEFLCTFEVKIKLEFPYKMMNMKQYRENLEWRFVKIIANIKEEMERRN